MQLKMIQPIAVHNHVYNNVIMLDVFMIVTC